MYGCDLLSQNSHLTEVWQTGGVHVRRAMNLLRFYDRIGHTPPSISTDGATPRRRAAAEKLPCRTTSIKTSNSMMECMVFEDFPEGLYGIKPFFRARIHDRMAATHYVALISKMPRTIRFLTFRFAAPRAAILIVTVTNAVYAADSNLVTTQKLRWQTAAALASEAVRVCASRGYSVTSTVVDPSGHEQAVVKGDMVPLQSLSVSYRKAYTAYSYSMAFNKDSTSELIAAKVTGPLDGGVLATVPEVIFIAGGVTLRKGRSHGHRRHSCTGAPGGRQRSSMGASGRRQI